MWFADFQSLEIDRQPASERIVASIALLVAACVPWLLSPSVPRLLVAIAVCGVVYLACGFAGLIGTRRRVAKAIWDSDGRWWLVDAANLRYPATLASSSTVFPHFIWLHWQSPRGARHLFLWRSTRSRRFQADDWRRLVARLRLRGVQQPSSMPVDGELTAPVVGPIRGA